MWATKWALWEIVNMCVCARLFDFFYWNSFIKVIFDHFSNQRQQTHEMRFTYMRDFELQCTHETYFHLISSCASCGIGIFSSLFTFFNTCQINYIYLSAYNLIQITWIFRTSSYNLVTMKKKKENVFCMIIIMSNYMFMFTFHIINCIFFSNIIIWQCCFEIEFYLYKKVL